MTAEQHITYEKVMSRDSPLVMIESWYNVFAHSLTPLLHLAWPRPIFRYHRGTVESYRPRKAFYEELPFLALRKIKEDSSCVQRLLQSAEVYKECAKKIKAKKASALSSSKAMQEITEVTELFTRGGAPLIALYWCATWNDQWKKKEGKEMFPKEVVAVAEEIRKDDALFDEGVVLSYGFLDILAKNEGWRAEDLKLLTLQELGEVVSSRKIPEHLIQLRKQGYCLIEGKMYGEDEAELELQRRNILFAEPSLQRYEGVLKGNMAHAGKVTGKAVIVFNREQFSKVHTGDILVAPMTTPMFVPIMERAAAFVTDEGGILCHAAIVAREMKKPCLTGTQIATKVLHDGDVLEVNATEGTVKVLY